MYEYKLYNCFSLRGKSTKYKKECKNKNKIKEVFVLKNLTKLKEIIQMN